MHNDLHLENVVFDRDTYTLRTLDYGRYRTVYMPKYTSNTDIIDAVILQGHHRHSRYEERMAMELQNNHKTVQTVANTLE
jgi:hypothetical protein